MGGYPGGYPALAVKQPDPMMDFAVRAMQIRGMMMGQRLSDIEAQQKLLGVQQAQITLAGTQRAIDAQLDPKFDPTDPQKALAVLRDHSVPLEQARTVLEGINQFKNILSQASSQQLKEVQDFHDFADDRITAARNAPPGPKQEKLYQDGLQAMRQRISMMPPGPSREYSLSEVDNAPAYFDDQWAAEHHALFRTSASLNEEALKNAQIYEAASKGQQAAAETAKIQGAATPGSAYYAPTAASLQLAGSQGDKQAQAILAGQTRQAGRQAGAEAAAKFPYELGLKQAEQAPNPIFAVNQRTGQMEQTTWGDYRAGGIQTL